MTGSQFLAPRLEVAGAAIATVFAQFVVVTTYIFVIGVITSSLLIFLPKSTFSIFIREENVVREGIVYLKYHNFLCA